MKLLVTSFEFSDSRLPPTGGIGSFYNGYISDMNKENIDTHFLGCSEKYIEIDDKKHVFGFYYTSFIRKLCSHPNFFVVVLMFPLDFFIRLRYSILVKNYVKKHAIDIIEAPDYKGVSSLFKLIGVKIPIVIRTHGTNKVLSDIKVQKRHVGLCFHEKIALRNCNGVIYISEASKKYLSESFSFVLNKKSTLAYNYIHPYARECFKPVKLPGKINVCYFGTLSDGKGIDMLFDIMLHVRDDKDIHFTLIGKSGDYFNELSNKSCYRELKNYTYLGPINYAELQDKLNNFDFFIFPTKFENCPLSWFEAMSHKKTMLCSNIPVAKEIIKDFHSGIICNSLDDYLSGLSHLKDETVRNVMGNNAYNNVVNKFAWHSCFDKSLRFYNELING
ncbi:MULTISPECIES: glycosyltransferase family 4 protein [unclassified Vibrio]|uniref:glycosyltransferase family 4 protein n=1 Tax=unclassified Vibrio TaxID=2614977 RepID=UPI00148277AE|nr:MULTISPECIES: glycosyltransferase family 4 protein [unclassified Vibrio]MDQ2192086.1 glycosyltransferase family 4 protein [Vibrio sp. A14(2019)]MDQ2197039.1 glycosyltransferase family 4 protein [Vibrio sp. 2017_1457_11]NNN76256.1 glycosyltransferase family 4 protein [Vibrio sp. B7]NNN92847.1 glycosyltransferase family 4 protein [Vibrio sp. B8-1]NNO08302.1 glycosyltransferase family 4 protein [Vibrio sp. B4-12]